jgi:hypothetical protein
MNDEKAGRQDRTDCGAAFASRTVVADNVILSDFYP